VPKFEVISEFLDRKTGERKLPGHTVEAEGQRIEDLRQAHVIGDVVQEKAPGADKAPDKLKKADLVKIAVLVGIEGASDMTLPVLGTALEGKQPELVVAAGALGVEGAEGMTMPQLLEAIHKAHGEA
jgi:hypothetical protein